MPNLWLPVPHCRQSRDGACLPACARMALLYMGMDIPEARLARILGTRTFGTPARRIARLETLGIQTAIGAYSEVALRSWLRQNIPVIIFLQTGALPYWTTDTYHAVVLVGMTESTVYLNDPAQETAPQTASLQSFLLAWSEFDDLAAILTPTPKET